MATAHPVYTNDGNVAGAGDFQAGALAVVYLRTTGVTRWILLNSLGTDREIRNVNQTSLAAMTVWGDLFVQQSAEIGGNDGVWNRTQGYPLAIKDESGLAANGNPGSVNAARRLALAFVHSAANLAAFLGFRSDADAATNVFRLRNYAAGGGFAFTSRNAADLADSTHLITNADTFTLSGPGGNFFGDSGGIAGVGPNGENTFAHTLNNILIGDSAAALTALGSTAELRNQTNQGGVIAGASNLQINAPGPVNALSVATNVVTLGNSGDALVANAVGVDVNASANVEIDAVDIVLTPTGALRSNQSLRHSNIRVVVVPVANQSAASPLVVSLSASDLNSIIVVESDASSSGQRRYASFDFTSLAGTEGDQIWICYDGGANDGIVRIRHQLRASVGFKGWYEGGRYVYASGVWRASPFTDTELAS